MCENNPAGHQGFFHRAFYLYYDGFRSMTLGRTLWTIIVIKLAVMFLVLKLFFFPNFLSTNASKGDEPEFVSSQLMKRAPLQQKSEQ